MVILYAKEPSYIRCIKPNYFKRANEFDSELVRHQVKYLSLMENLRVRRAGYAYKKSFELFLDKYKCLCPQTWPNYKGGEARKGVAILLNYLNYKLDDDYSLGVTKIFIRKSKTFFELEDLFDVRREYLASLIKAAYKGFRQRLEYKRMLLAGNVINKAAHKWLARKHLQKRIAAKKVLRKFFTAYAKRNEPFNEQNAVFCRIWFSRYLLDLVKELPRTHMDKTWPRLHPSPLKQVKHFIHFCSLIC
jgi:myosin-1